jgi:cell division septal protein FtsQ
MGSSRKKSAPGVFRPKGGLVVSHGVDLKPDSPKIREMEKKAVQRKGFKWAVGAVIVICLIALLKITVREAFLKNPQFSLRQIAVHTEGPLTVQKIVRTTALTDGANLLTINMREIRARLEQLPQVKAAKVGRDHAGGLIIDVKQRQPVAWIECARLGLIAGRSSSGYLLDAEGVSFPCEAAMTAYQTLPLIRFDSLSQNPPGTPIPDLQLKAALKLLNELQKRFEQGTEELRLIDIQTPYSMVATFADRSQVTFGVDDLDLQLVRLDRVRQEARKRQWEIETLNLLARQNVPVTFRSAPDLEGLQNLQAAISTVPKPVRKTAR